MHAPSARESEGWAERDHGTLLPCVYITLKELGDTIRKIIKVGGGESTGIYMSRTMSSFKNVSSFQ